MKKRYLVQQLGCMCCGVSTYFIANVATKKRSRENKR